MEGCLELCCTFARLHTVSILRRLLAAIRWQSLQSYRCVLHVRMFSLHRPCSPLPIICTSLRVCLDSNNPSCKCHTASFLYTNRLTHHDHLAPPQGLFSVTTSRSGATLCVQFALNGFGIRNAFGNCTLSLASLRFIAAVRLRNELRLHFRAGPWLHKRSNIS